MNVVATSEVGAHIDTLGFSTNYHDAGTGEPLLLIHGSGPGVSAWANWRLTLPALSPQFRVIAPDMVGFGYTQSPPGVDYSLDLWVGQAVALLDGLGLSSVSVVGNSFGGAVALALASRYPERVRRLALMGSVGASFPITEGLDKVWGYQPSFYAMGELLRLFAYDPAIVTDDLVEMRYRASIRDDVQQRFATLFPAPRQRWVEALAQGEDALRAIHHPTLLIHGREDKVIPLACSQTLAGVLPDARLAVIERCGHWVQIERAGEFIPLLIDFLGAQGTVGVLPNRS